MDTPYCSTSQPPQPPQPPPLAVAPPTPTPTPTPFNHHRINNHPFEDNNPSLSFHPPTTPTTNCSPSPSSSSSFRKKRRSKLLRIDTAAPKQTETTPPCTECGKTFWSWKALFGHMRCHPERQWRGINPPPHLRRPPQIQPPPLQTPPPSSSDDHVVAASLLLLASAPTSTVGPTPRFECSSCKKTFGSHQALGGHRASHKNVKGCFAITHTHTTTPTTTATTTTTTTVEDYAQSCLIMSGNNPEEDGLGLGLGLGLGMGHRCGLCWKVFSTGQALGGHMRRHLLDKNNEEQASSSSSVGLGLGLGLDLNHNHDPAGRVQEDGWVHSGSNSTELDLRLSL